MRSERAAPILEALCEEGGVQDSAALAARAVAALCKRSPDKCAAHVAAMVDAPALGEGIPGSGRAVAHLFARLPRHAQGAILTRLSAKRAAYLVSWLGPKRGAAAWPRRWRRRRRRRRSRRRPWRRSRTSGSRAAATVTAPAPRRRSWRRCTPRTPSRLPARSARWILAAAAVAGLPGDAAALASGVKDPTTVAAMLEEMPADKRAAMLIKMDAEASAAAASAMDPGLAGEAMEAARRAALLNGADADAFGDALGDAAEVRRRRSRRARLRDSDLGAGPGTSLTRRATSRRV